MMSLSQKNKDKLSVQKKNEKCPSSLNETLLQSSISEVEQQKSYIDSDKSFLNDSCRYTSQKILQSLELRKKNTQKYPQCTLYLILLLIDSKLNASQFQCSGNELLNQLCFKIKMAIGKYQASITLNSNQNIQSKTEYLFNFLLINQQLNQLSLKYQNLDQQILNSIFLNSKAVLLHLSSHILFDSNDQQVMINLLRIYDIRATKLNKHILLLQKQYFSNPSQDKQNKVMSSQSTSVEDRKGKWIIEEGKGYMDCLLRVDDVIYLDLLGLRRGKYMGEYGDVVLETREIFGFFIQCFQQRIIAIEDIEIVIKIGRKTDIFFEVKIRNQLNLKKILQKIYEIGRQISILDQKINLSQNISINFQQFLTFNEYIKKITKHPQVFHPIQKQHFSYCQSAQQIFDITEEDRASKSMNDILDSLRRKDMLSIKSQWDTKIRLFMKEICQNWELYQYLLGEQLRIFTCIHLVKKQIFKASIQSSKNTKYLSTNFIERTDQFYQRLYPQMNNYLNFLKEKLQIKSINQFLQQLTKQKKRQITQKMIDQQIRILMQSLKMQEHTADKLFHYFLKEQSDKIENKQFNIRIKITETVQLNECIYNCLDNYYNIYRWKNIFDYIIESFREFQSKIDIKPTYLPQKQSNRYLLDNIQQQRLVDIRCIGCCKFFNSNQNIYDRQINSSPIKFYDTISKIKDNESAIRDDICSMLNSGGGVILFDCMKQYQNIYPRGKIMSQKQKEQYEQRIYSYCNIFYPKLEVKQNIYVTFVPVIIFQNAQNKELLKDPNNFQYFSGQQATLKNKRKFLRRKCGAGLFVTRIKVIPAQPHLVYFWYTNTNSKNAVQPQIKNYCQIYNQNGQRENLSNKSILRYIKKKIKDYYIDSSLSPQQKLLLQSDTKNIEHVCQQPQLGQALREEEKHVFIDKFQQKRENKPNSLESKYSYVTIFIAQKQNHDKIKNNLQRRRIQFEMVSPFGEYCFKSAYNTTIIYHNIKFQQIQSEIKNNRSYIFNGRQVMAINMTSFLKIELNEQRFLTEYQFQSICNAFSHQFPQESLKVYQFLTENYRRQIFLLTQSKISNLFLYYFLTENNYKAYFKNPFLLDKMNAQQRQKRLLLIYEKKGRMDFLLQSYLSVKKWENQSYQSKQNVSAPEQNDFSYQYQRFLSQFQKISLQSSQKSIQCKKESLQLEEFKEELEKEDDFLFESWQELLQSYIEMPMKEINLLK